MRGPYRRCAFIFVGLIVAAALDQFPRQSLAQNQSGDEHSYLRIVIGDRALTNLAQNEEHQKGGWLAIEPVLVKSTRPTPGVGGSTDIPKGWRLLSEEMKSGHHGPGTLSFGVGDDGGLEPLLAAQKNSTIIPSADLDLFLDNDKTRTRIGKYLIKRIRIVAVEDVPASACSMYYVTIRFQSIESRAL